MVFIEDKNYQKRDYLRKLNLFGDMGRVIDFECVALPWSTLPARFYIPAYIVTAGLLLYISTKLKYTQRIPLIAI